jgi:hypothetical protein
VPHLLRCEITAERRRDGEQPPAFQPLAYCPHRRCQ